MDIDALKVINILVLNFFMSLTSSTIYIFRKHGIYYLAFVRNQIVVISTIKE